MADNKFDKTKNEIIKEIDEVKEEIVDVKEDLIEEIRADESRSEKKNKSLFIIIFILAVVIIGVVYYNKKGGFATEQSVPKQEAVDKGFEYIKKYLAPGMELTIGSIDENKKTFYKFIVKSGEQEIPTYVSIDGKTMIFSEVDITKDPTAAANTDTANTTQIDGKNVIAAEGNFQEVEGAEVCKENGKPIVYFFGSETCPHCQWQKPVLAEALATFGDKISYHESIDSDKDADIFTKFNSTGGVPTIVVGCKYFRIGSGENSGADADKQALINIINNVLK